MTNALTLLVFGFLLMHTPVALAKRAGAKTEGDVWLWLSRLDHGRYVLLTLLMASGLFFALGGTLLLMGAWT